jgi:hypothetical protein
MNIVIVRHCAGETDTRPENRYLANNHLEATNRWLAEAHAAGFDGYELDAPNGKVLDRGHAQFAPDWPFGVVVPDATLLVRFPRRRMVYLANPVGLGDDWRTTWKQTIRQLAGWCTHVVLDASSYAPVYLNPRLVEAVVMLGQAGIRAVMEAQVPNIPSDPGLNAPAWMRQCGVMFRSEWMRPWDAGQEPPYVHPQEHPEAFCMWDGSARTFPSAEHQAQLLGMWGTPGKRPDITARWCAAFVQFCDAWGITPMLSSDWAGGPVAMRSLMSTAGTPPV